MASKNNKLIKDVDEATWNKFIAYCKISNVKAGDQLNKVLDEFLKKKFKRLLK